MKAIKNLILIPILMGLFCQPLLAQESILKDELEHKRERKYCFYPSTLRMINLKNDQTYNDLVGGVDKLLIYQLDSTTRADKSYLTITEKYTEAEFEEYATAFGGGISLSIMGKEGSNKDEYVGFFAQNQEAAFAFYLRGKIPWQKIPTLFQNLQDMEMVELFDFKNGTF